MHPVAPVVGGTSLDEWRKRRLRYIDANHVE
jgi:hypothetical protein